MKLTGNYLFRSICTIMVGLLLILNPDTPVFLIRIIAVLLALTGIYSLFNYLMNRFGKNASHPAAPVVGIGCLVLGCLLGIHPEAFIKGLMYIMGGLILFLGFGQLTSVFNYRSIAPLKWTVFVLPILIILMGLYVIVHYKEAAELPFKILGICCLFNGISDLFYGLRVRHYERMNNKFTKYEDVTEEYEEAEEVNDPS